MPYEHADAPSWPPPRHPHQVYLMVACCVAGVLGILSGGGAPSLSRYVEPALFLVWNLTLVGAGACGLAAAWYATRDGVLSLLLERICLAVVGPAALLYAVLLAYGQGLVQAGFALGMTVGFGLACLVRLRQVLQSIRWLHARNGHHAEMNRQKEDQDR